MEKKFKILSIDGGGIRGIIPLEVLVNLENELQQLHGPEARLCDCFDLVCGTSTGGIIAIAVALGIPMRHVQALYDNHAKDIFPSKGWRKLINIITKGVFYSRKTLKSLIEKTFYSENNGVPISLDNCNTRVCIPAFDLHSGKMTVYKTKHHKEYVRDYHIPVADIALATSAAPVYFSPYSFEYETIDSNIKRSSKNIVDGGVVANNPSLIGLIEATCCIGKAIHNIQLLSLGTGYVPLVNQTKRIGMSFWLLPFKKFGIYEVMSFGQSENIHNTIKMLHSGVGNENKNLFDYIRLQPRLEEDINLDASDDISIKKLHLIGQELYIDSATKLRMFIEDTVISYKFNQN